MCRVIRRKSLGSYPKSVIKKMKYEKYFFGDWQNFLKCFVLLEMSDLEFERRSYVKYVSVEW